MSNVRLCWRDSGLGIGGTTVTMQYGTISPCVYKVKVTNYTKALISVSLSLSLLFGRQSLFGILYGPCQGKAEARLGREIGKTFWNFGKLMKRFYRPWNQETKPPVAFS